MQENDSDELKKIEKEIGEDFERTDREIQEAMNKELKTLEKWTWQVWGIFCSVAGILILLYLNIYGGAWTFMAWAWFLFGAALLGCGILSFIFRDVVFWLQ